MRRKKVLLMIGAGVEQVPAIRTAKKQGYFVLATDGNLHAPGFRYADDHYTVDTYDAKKTAAFAAAYNKKRRINGVIAVAADVPITVSTVAKELRLPGNTLKTARLSANKLLMKKKFRKDGVPIPWFAPIRSIDDLKRIVRKRGYPLIIKPVDSRGARGVLRLTESIDLPWAYRTALSCSPSGSIMVEEFLNGPQISTESVVYDGLIVTPGLSDRNYEYLNKYAPFIIENGGELPANLTKEQKERVDELLAECARSLGIVRGTLKGDMVITDKGPKIIEVAARLSGGWFCTDEIPLSTGVRFVEAAIGISMGIRPDLNELRPKFQKGVALRFFFPPEGKVRAISGIRKARKIKGVHRLDVYVKTGDVIKKISDHTRRAGYVISAAKTKDKAVAIAKKAIAMTRIDVRKMRCQN